MVVPTAVIHRDAELLEYSSSSSSSSFIATVGRITQNGRITEWLIVGSVHRMVTAHTWRSRRISQCVRYYCCCYSPHHHPHLHGHAATPGMRMMMRRRMMMMRMMMRMGVSDLTSQHPGSACVPTDLPSGPALSVLPDDDDDDDFHHHHHHHCCCY